MMTILPRRLSFTLLLVLLAFALPGDTMAQRPAPFAQKRYQMVAREIEAAGVTNARVLKSMRTTPRHEFVSRVQRQLAYFDMALPIGESQTISSPFIVAFMTELLDPRPTDKVLEIGTGSGYQAAVLSPLVQDVYTIEIVTSLGRKAAKTLKRLGYKNVHAKIGDGYQGWPEHAPFDKIIVTCSPEKVPPALVAQLKEGGRMVIPVGERYQQTMYLAKKIDGEMTIESLRPTLFVPMTGKAEQRRKVLPDPANPSIDNGGFEEVFGDPPKPAAWYYARQMKLIEDTAAPEGKRYVTFSNEVAGKGAQMLQGLPVDGRKVRALTVSLSVCGKDLRPGQTRQQQALLAISFFDENRARVGDVVVGPWQGTFDWRIEAIQIPVPLRAREGLLRVGMFGARGEISFDDIVLKAAGN